MASPRHPQPSSARRPAAQRPPDHEKAPDKVPDKIIGEFRRGKEIGKGSFATVYLVHHPVSGIPRTAYLILGEMLPFDLATNGDETANMIYRRRSRMPPSKLWRSPNCLGNLGTT